MHFLRSLFFLYFLFNYSTIAANDSGGCRNVSLQVLGSGGPEINDGLASSSYLIWHHGKAKIMVDAGGGSSYNFEKSGASFNDLEAVLLTHLHVDHSAALPIYVKAGYFTQRERNLSIYGPKAGSGFPSTTSYVNALFGMGVSSAYPYLSDNLIEQASTDFLLKPFVVSPTNKIWSQHLSNNIRISAINVNHAHIPALAWRVSIGQCSITFSGDMNGSSGNLERLANETNLLVANNAIPENANNVARHLHMTPSKIATIAKTAKTKVLLLSHFMTRSSPLKKKTVSLIQKDFVGEIILAEELMKIELK